MADRFEPALQNTKINNRLHECLPLLILHFKKQFPTSDMDKHTFIYGRMAARYFKGLLAARTAIQVVNCPLRRRMGAAQDGSTTMDEEVTPKGNRFGINRNLLMLKLTLFFMYGGMEMEKHIAFLTVQSGNVFLSRWDEETILI